MAPMETDPEPTQVRTQEGTRDAPPPATGPMETDEPSSGGQARLPSQPSTPRSRPRTTASTQPSGMCFCPMPRCARREWALPTGWSCLQSLVSHLRSVHLSTGAAPPDAWLDTHGLRVCLSCREITPQGARCPGPRCSMAVLAALALGNTAPTAQARSPVAGPLTAGLDLVHLLGTRISTLRRVPIRASSTCARALTCLLPALEREQIGRPWLVFSCSSASPSQPPHEVARQRGPQRPSSVVSTAWRALWTC